ncbi:hypothetical protein PBI_MRMAGOO_137 [Mycobacterium phage MrMagoo]|uniref:Uncharacterized protein n=1 Tax=Mycobacterium phage MrMagoo TaxID=1927020 RepID=A0A1L6BYQ6_9CAUD|nr:hypothetical protein J4U04_gp143 [Mycobacterium phage MrMagoo]APQ42219.1 hypothetical protein PBI_MRMAGOO_137 [Mycobacterium phage MrMagoo]
MTPQEFYQKVEWEGGLAEAVFSYGLNDSDLDDSDPVLKEAIRAFSVMGQLYDRANYLLQKHDPFLEGDE